MLGPGHGPLLREDVAAAAIRPTLQGEETSQMTSVQPASQPPDVEMTQKQGEEKNANKVTGTKPLQAQSPDVRKRPTVGSK